MDREPLLRAITSIKIRWLVTLRSLVLWGNLNPVKLAARHLLPMGPEEKR